MTRPVSTSRRRVLRAALGALALCSVPAPAVRARHPLRAADAIAWLHRSGFGQHALS
jgi:hypothetical protein